MAAMKSSPAPIPQPEPQFTFTGPPPAPTPALFTFAEPPAAPTPAAPTSAAPTPAASKKRKSAPVMSHAEVEFVVYTEMAVGSLAEATREYLSCLDNCHLRFPDGGEEKRPAPRNRKKRPTLSGPKNRKRRLTMWKTQNALLNNCLKSCKDKWYKAATDLIGEANLILYPDILSHILSMLVKQPVKKKSVKKKGGRKTRRKKGTKRRKCKSKKKY